jgi:uncharacterized membrane protein YebE (DUF533 family)
MQLEFGGKPMTTNPAAPKDQFNVLREQIQSSLEKAQVQKNTLKRSNSRYTTANIILGALAALLAGTAGTIGSAKSWKPVCLVAAICSAGAAATAKLQTGEQLTEASECVGQLKALKVETIAPPDDLEKVSEKYQQILSEFSTIDC